VSPGLEKGKFKTIWIRPGSPYKDGTYTYSDPGQIQVTLVVDGDDEPALQTATTEAHGWNQLFCISLHMDV